MHKFLLSFCAAMFVASTASAFTCLNDYSGSNGCAKNPTPAGDCATLGYSTATIPSDCERILTCPFNSAYKRCAKTKDECPDGYSINYTSKESCGTEATWTFDGQLVGSLFCGKCTCNAPSNCLYDSSSGIGTLGGKCCNGKYQTCIAPAECKWTDSNKGTANLSDKCCNGNYKTCTSACVEVTVPANATASEKCTGCGKEVVTAFNCNTGYTKTADGKSCVKNTEPCQIGDYFNSDYTCSATFVESKKPIGVVALVFNNIPYAISPYPVKLVEQGYTLENGETTKGVTYVPEVCRNTIATIAPVVPELAGQCSCAYCGSNTIPSIEEVRYNFKPCINTSFKPTGAEGWVIPSQEQWKQTLASQSKIDDSLQKAGWSTLSGRWRYYIKETHSSCGSGEVATIYSDNPDNVLCEKYSCGNGGDVFVGYDHASPDIVTRFMLPGWQAHRE